jgi:hypothetical protein
MKSTSAKDKSETAQPEAIRLMLAYLCIATEKEASLERKVEILDKFDLSDSEIAKVCGGAIQSIRNARHYLRKHGQKSKTSY